MILVDYRCTTCAATSEAAVARPIPPQRPCTCGGTMRRLFTAAGLVGAKPAPAATADLSCAANRAIPGFCHLGAAARRAAYATWTGDDTTRAAEIKRQTERFERSGPPPLSEVVSHVHPASGA